MKKFKKVLKYLVLVVVLIPCVFLFSACNTLFSERSIVSIEKTNTTGLVDTYTISYSDNTTSTFTVTNGRNGFNGKDAESVTITEIYNTLVEKGYTKSFDDFLKEYLSYEVKTSDRTASINTAILSSVSIYSQFQVIKQQYVWPGSVQNVKSTEVGAGSGVIYKLDKENGDAYIITNYHVVYNKDGESSKIGKIRVFLYGSFVNVGYKTDANGNYVYDTEGYPIVEYSSDAIECEYVGGSLNYDIAVLKISNSEILKNSSARAVTLSEDYHVGDTAIAIGNPEAQGISVTEGIVSVESEYIQMNGADESTLVTFRALRIDTAINAGNSGGGLFNEFGELIGIVNAKIVDTSIENIAYAIPKSIAINVADNLIFNFEANGTNQVNKITVGLLLNIDSSHAEFNNNTKTTNIIEQISILQVQDGSQAQSAGFEVGDQLISITIGEKTYKIDRMFQAIDLALTIRVGDSVTYTVMRGGESLSLTFTANASSFNFVE
ncbi:MAG: S1C family serine protease [Christensenellales bacterium]